MLGKGLLSRAYRRNQSLSLEKPCFQVWLTVWSHTLLFPHGNYHFFLLGSHVFCDSFLKVPILSNNTCTNCLYHRNLSDQAEQDSPLRSLPAAEGVQGIQSITSASLHSLSRLHYFSSRECETETMRLTDICGTCIPLSQDILSSRMSHKNLNYFLMLVMKNGISVLL